MEGAADHLLTVPGRCGAGVPHVLINCTKNAIMRSVPLQEAAQPKRQDAVKRSGDGRSSAGGESGLPPIPETARRDLKLRPRVGWTVRLISAPLMSSKAKKHRQRISMGGFSPDLRVNSNETRGSTKAWLKESL